MKSKTLLSFLCCAFGLATCLQAAPAYMKDDPYANLPRFNFTAKKGKWDVAKNWQEGKVPNAGWSRAQIKGGCTLTVSCPVDNSESINLGALSSDKCEMYIENGAKMKLSLLFVPFAGHTGSNAVAHMRGGELSVGNDKDGGGVLSVGTGGTFSGTGVFELSGGKFKGGIKVGSSIANTQHGTLIVKGSQASVSTNTAGNNFLMLEASGTLEFQLDEKGVTLMNYRGGRVHFYPGCTVRVDGKNYKPSSGGGARTITLIEADKIPEGGARFEAVNFPDELDAKIFITEKGGYQQLVVRINPRKK